MEPKYRDGDMVYVKYCDSADDGDDVICSTSDGAVIKHKKDNKIYSLNSLKRKLNAQVCSQCPFSSSSETALRRCLKMMDSEGITGGLTGPLRMLMILGRT